MSNLFDTIYSMTRERTETRREDWLTAAFHAVEAWNTRPGVPDLGPGEQLAVLAAPQVREEFSIEGDGDVQP